MRSIWIFGVILHLFACIYAGPLDVVYSCNGCDCPYKFNYQAAVPQPPKPPKYIPNNYNYEIDMPQIQAKAKVSYTFDLSIEEPKPPCSVKSEKLNSLTKLDRIALHKPDCPYAYMKSPSPSPAPAPCNCGLSKPIYRYVNGDTVQPCRCGRPKCKCNSRYPSSMNIETPVLVASGPLKFVKHANNIRRKRDLERIFFRPHRPEQLRSPRFVKLYNKPISAEKEKENWLNMDFFSDAIPLKRKTKKVFFPDFRSRIVKRDIKGEYDLLEKERQEMDLTIPEIIQFMPETLRPDFKRGPCQFVCRREFSEANSAAINSNEMSDENREQPNKMDTSESAAASIKSSMPTTTTPVSVDDEPNRMHSIANSFTKRNANGCSYQPPMPPILYPQSDFPAQNPNPTNPQHVPAPTLCEQRKLYAAMRRATDPQNNSERLNHRFTDENNQLGLLYSASRSVPDPFRPDSPPLQYTGDLEVPQLSYVYGKQDPLLGAPNYPVQHVSSEVLDRIISDIVYRHPDFIEASAHYGGALVDPEPEQAEQIKDFIKKLIDGRLSLFFDEPDHDYLHYYSVPSFISYARNPYETQRPSTIYRSAMY